MTDKKHATGRHNKTSPCGNNKYESKPDRVYDSGKAHEHTKASSTSSWPTEESPDWFPVDTQHVIVLLLTNEAEVVDGVVNYEQAKWYVKGIVDILRQVRGPAFKKLNSHLEKMVTAFTTLDKADLASYNTFKENLRNHLSEEREKNRNH